MQNEYFFLMRKCENTKILTMDSFYIFSIKTKKQLHCIKIVTSVNIFNNIKKDIRKVCRCKYKMVMLKLVTALVLKSFQAPLEVPQNL